MKHFGIICLFLCTLTFGVAQEKDTSAVRELMRQGDQSTLDSAAFFYEKALAIANEIDFSDALFTLYTDLGTLHENRGEYSVSVEWYQKGLAYAKKKSDLAKEARFHTNLAIIAYYQGNWDESIALFAKAIDIYKKLDNKERIADGYSNLANLYLMKGTHLQSVEHYLKALKLFEEIDLQNGVGSTLFNLGSLYNDRGDDSLALHYFKYAEEVFRSEKDSLFLGHTLSALWEFPYDNDQLDSAEQILLEALFLFDRQQSPFGEMHCYSKLGTVYRQMGQLERAEEMLDQSIQMAESMGNDQHICWGLMDKAQIEKERDNFELAISYADRSMSIAQQLGMADFYYAINKIRSEIYAHFGYYRQALEYYEAYSTQQDSILNETKNRQIAELQTIYETEKKDKEISLLEKNAAIARLKISSLGIGIGAFLLIALMLFSRQRLKYVKDQEIYAQQEQIQREQLRIANLEQSRLSQELSSQVLNFCRKNEFLQSLKTDMEQLPSAPDASRIRKLIRRINTDLQADSDWEAFLQSFAQVHPGFTKKLNLNYPNLTPNEIRLATLMKMNLSGKEIASLLNISVDSIKKARHRLRKKMNLDSTVNLPEYILRF